MSLSPGVRRMWPSHCHFLTRIAVTRSKVWVLGLASQCTERPVIRARHREFAPFSLACSLGVSDHASHP